MPRLILIMILGLFMASPALAVQVIPVSPSADGLTTKSFVTSSYAVNDFSDPINGCTAMTVALSPGLGSVVSVYMTDVDSTPTIAEIGASPLAGILSSSNTAIATFTPVRQQIRFVVDTPSSSRRGQGGELTVTCQSFLAGVLPLFYGLPIHANSNFIFESFDFNVFRDSTLNPVDPPSALNNGPITAAISPWSIVYSAEPTGATLGEVLQSNTTDGTLGIRFGDDVQDNIALNLVHRGTTFFLPPAIDRIAAVEIRVALQDPDDVDVFLGVCRASTGTLLQTDGTLAVTTYAGFHWLRTRGESFPLLTQTAENFTPITTPAVPDYVDGAAQSQDFIRYAIKMLDQEKIEYYMDDVLVGSFTATASLDFEQHVCIGLTTTGTAGSKMWVDSIKWAVEKQIF